MTIEDFVVYSVDHFESHLLGNESALVTGSNVRNATML